MKTVNIQINLNSLDVRDSKVTGRICLSAGEIFFPEQNWNDFVLTVLSWWLEKADNLNQELSNSEDFLFMDGPFKFNIKKDGTECSVKLFRRDSLMGEIEPFSWKDFYNSLLNSAQNTINAYLQQTNYQNQDIKTVLKYLNQAEL